MVTLVDPSQYRIISLLMTAGFAQEDGLGLLQRSPKGATAGPFHP
jgi:hypothetical protein